LLSASNLGGAGLSQYARFIVQYRPEKMYGYASAFYLLARYFHTTGYTPPQDLKAIFPTAEPLFDFQRQTIQETFACQVATEYGARDAGLMANECPSGSLHVPAEAMLVEVEGTEADGLGEIVVTNLYSPAMPIIRYRTGDLGRFDPTPCPCGRGLPRLKGVEGRRTDFIVTPDGRVLHALSVIYILRETPGLKEFRVVQEAVDRLTVQVVPEGDFPEASRNRILVRMRRLMGDGVDVTVEAVPALPTLPSGKFRYVISRVADQYVDNLLAGAGVGHTDRSGKQ
jgi:phenylacetate-CoA ligase